MNASPRRTKGPIFVVGSPRSGTSILTWCLGQHPNILLLEESNWMTAFAVDVAVAFRRGSLRAERSQFSSMGMCREDLMRDIGQAVNKSILAHRTKFEATRAARPVPGRPGAHPAFQISRAKTDAKSRWVNGTPEYSLLISGLRKLFPHARFIHLLRNVEEVIPSMVQFERVTGLKLVSDEDQAYQYWMRTVRACLEAEHAYGPRVVYRLNYDELVGQSERAMRSILHFVGEPFSANCLEPLEKRINSSRVVDGASENYSTADSGLIREAKELWRELCETPAPTEPSPSIARRLERGFEERVEHTFNLDAKHHEAQRMIVDLQKESAERTNWALHSNQEIARKDAFILQLQEELADRTRWAQSLQEEVASKDACILQLQQELAERTRWAQSLQEEIAHKDAYILQLQQEFAVRSAWALDLNAKSARKDATILELRSRLERSATSDSDEA
jgi:hypothetical protein